MRFQKTRRGTVAWCRVVSHTGGMTNTATQEATVTDDRANLYAAADDLYARGFGAGGRVHSMESRPFATAKRRGIPATDRTREYLSNLQNELTDMRAEWMALKGASAEDIHTFRNTAADLMDEQLKTLTQSEASAVIDRTKESLMKGRAELAKLRASAGNAPAAAPAWELTEGAYMLDGKAVLVQRSRESKRLYAKVWDADAETFVYAKGITYRLRAEHRMTLEQAAEFGKAFGVCAECGRLLTNKLSVELGIGPICRANF